MVMKRTTPTTIAELKAAKKIAREKFARDWRGLSPREACMAADEIERLSAALSRAAT